MPDLLLSGEQAETVALVLEYALRTARRNGAPAGRLRDLADVTAVAVPMLAARLPEVLRAAGPETAAAVKAQAARAAGNGQAPETAWLGASEAARVADVDARTVRAAAAAGRLAASKDRVTGEWRITAADLDRWMEARSGT
jgi:excisionase family DNA binding protein